MVLEKKKVSLAAVKAAFHLGAISWDLF